MAKSGMLESGVDSEDDGNEVYSMETAPGINGREICSGPENVVSRSTHPSIHISILIQSLVKSLCHILEPDSKKVIKVYNHICEKLSQMKLIDESWNMVEFESIRARYEQALHHLLRTSIGGGDQLVPIQPIWIHNDLINSHYSQEFDEIEYIAGGGFGQVYRVKHKLDGTEYAIKKIPIAAEGIEAVRSYLSEVKTFASVNHSNIVQYKGAWLELGSPSASAAVLEETESITGSEESKISTDNNYIYNTSQHSFSDNKEDTSSSDFKVSFEPSVSSLEKRTTLKREKRSSISEGGKAICKLDMNELKELNHKHKKHIKWATLYIQMALCQSTLKQWLQARNDSELSLPNAEKSLMPVRLNVRNENIYEVLRQLLRGLEYIHSKGIVHHDIKPSNIFIQIDNGNWLVQLGDFGLACPLQNARHSLAFGTKMYAAPEQLEGMCDPKVLNFAFV